MKCSVPPCKREASDGFRRCDVCRAYIRVVSQKRRRDRKALGLCSITGCLAEHRPQRLMCERHLKIQAKAVQRYAEMNP